MTKGQLLCLLTLVPAVAIAEMANPSLLDLAKDPLLDQALYAVPHRMVTGIADDGAVGMNAKWESGQSPKWFIDQQNYGADLIQAGVVRQDRDLIAQGWKLFDWGFAHQSSDGGFAGTGDPFHSTSFFVEAVARALELERQSGNPAYQQDIDQHLAKLEAAAKWLMQPEVAAKGQHGNIPFAHRRWLLAAALGMTADLTGNTEMAKTAEAYARDGLSMQTPEGINPEKGGGDVDYQSFGILLAGRYYTVCHDEALRSQIKDMIHKGLQWELTKEDGHGNMSLEGSTRAGKEAGRGGTIKTTNYKQIMQTFLVGAQISADSSFADAAHRIAVGRKWIKS